MIATKNGQQQDLQDDLLHFRAQTITSSKAVEVGFDRALPAGEVARSISDMLSLPQETEWQLRLDRTAAFLDEKQPIGEQLKPGSQVSVTPRAHLGGRCWTR